MFLIRLGKPGLSCRSADVNRRVMPRSVLLLIAIATLVICNLHSPSMLHAEEAGHDDHATLFASDHHDWTSDAVPDVDHGTVAHDHHGPTAMTVAAARMEMPVPVASALHHLAEASKLASWATAPPIEPPAA